MSSRVHVIKITCYWAPKLYSFFVVPFLELGKSAARKTWSGTWAFGRNKETIKTELVGAQCWTVTTKAERVGLFNLGMSVFRSAGLVMVALPQSIISSCRGYINEALPTLFEIGFANCTSQFKFSNSSLEDSELPGHYFFLTANSQLP